MTGRLPSTSIPTSCGWSTAPTAWHFVPQDEHYSYVFQGNGQVLDHNLVSPALLLQGHPDLDAVHINAEFSDQVSDHDPPITRLDVR